MPLSITRKRELRNGVAVMIDLAWREGQYAVPPGDDHGLQELHSLSDEEVAYVQAVVERVAGRLFTIG